MAPNRRPQPRDYPSFEAYEKAVKKYEKKYRPQAHPHWKTEDLESMQQALETISNFEQILLPEESKAQAFYFCQEIQCLQAQANEQFFWGLLPTERFLLPKSSRLVPPRWLNQKGMEFNAITFLQDFTFDLTDLLKTCPEDSIAIRQLGQQSYELVYQILHTPSFPIVQVQQLKRRLERSPLFPKLMREPYVRWLSSIQRAR